MKKLTEKANTFQILTENGIEREKAYKLAGYKGTTQKAICEIEKRIKKHSVASPALVKLSKNAVRDTLQRLPSLQEVETAAGIKTVKVYPTHRDRLQAANIVLDRAEPKQNVNINADVDVQNDYIDLSAYRLPKPKVIDIQPSPPSGEVLSSEQANIDAVGNVDTTETNT